MMVVHLLHLLQKAVNLSNETLFASLCLCVIKAGPRAQTLHFGAEKKVAARVSKNLTPHESDGNVHDLLAKDILRYS